MATLTFEGPDLNAVANAALTFGKPVMLVKDDGVYLCVHPKEGQPGTVCYAKGYDPRKADVYDKAADAMGGDDGADNLAFKPDSLRALATAGASLKVRVSASSLALDIYGPKPSGDERRAILTRNFEKAGYHIIAWVNDNRVAVRKDGKTFQMQKGRGKTWKRVA